MENQKNLLDCMSSVFVYFEYKYKFNSYKQETFILKLDRKTLELYPTLPEEAPDWSQLEFCQCTNCPLSPEDNEFCPIALNMSGVIPFFSDVSSYEKVYTEIISNDRSYSKLTTSSEAISSLMGIFMVTSGCPIMDKLRPMVRFHLPFATAEETMFRALAMYLTAQYFRERQGKPCDRSLEGLDEIYAEVQEVNRCFSQRIQSATERDASSNAIVRLDAFASAVAMSLDISSLDELELLFGSYLKD